MQKGSRRKKAVKGDGALTIGRDIARANSSFQFQVIDLAIVVSVYQCVRQARKNICP